MSGLRSASWVRFALVVAVVSSVLAVLGPSASASQPSSLLVGNVLRGVDQWASLGDVPADREIGIGVALRHPDPAAEQRFVAAVTSPSSPLFGHFLTPVQYQARFGVAPAQLRKVEAWLRDKGFRVEEVAGSTDYVLARGTAAKVSRAFGTHLRRYRSSEGEFYANSSAPTVPADLGIGVVAGLNDLERPRAATPTLPAASSPPNGLTSPQVLWDVYQQPAANKGEGQRMAIFGWGSTAGVEADLRQFEAEYGLPATPLTVTHYGTEPSITDTGGAVEWRLDTQASTGMAPNVVGESLYFGDAGTDDDLLAAYSAWVNDPAGPLQGSSSFSGCEEAPFTQPFTGGPGNPGGLIAVANNKQDLYEQLLTQAVAEGRTMFASTGDTGSSCPVVAVSVNGVGNELVPLLGYPAASPHAVAVGGTVLYWNEPASGPATRTLEYAWTYTGGGTSQYLAAGDYQQGVSGVVGHCVTDPHGTPYPPPGPLCRGVPDVAAQSGDVISNGYTITVDGANDQAGGGTSLSSPLWLGMWTRMQAAAPDQVHGLGFANPLLYADAKDAAKYATDFSDVTVGCNGYYCATPGWDYVSGWGTPNVTNLMTHLAGKTTPTNPVPPPGTVGARTPVFDPCSPNLWTDDPADSSFAFGLGSTGSYQNLDLVSGGLSITSDGTSLVTRLTVANLDKTVPPPGGTNQYYALFNYDNVRWFTNVQVDSLGNVTYADGQVVQTGNTHVYTKRSGSNDTGSFNEGPNGTITVTAPLSAFSAAGGSSPKSGDDLADPAGETYVTVGSPTGSPASLQQVDAGGPQDDYAVGQVCTPQAAQSGPRALPSPSAVSFGSQTTGTTSGPQTITITNTGNADVTIAAVAVTGTNAGDFTKSPDSCSGVVVHAGGTCTVEVTFTPGASGSRTATLAVSDNAPDTPQSIGLAGLGTDPVPIADITPNAVGFGPQRVGTTSSAQTVTLKNTGPATMRVSGVATTGPDAGAFQLANDTCSGKSLATNATCAIDVRFAPSSTGTRSASLTFTDNAPDSPQKVGLAGTGVGPLTWSPTSVAFGNQPVFTSSQPASVTFTNAGSQSITMKAATITGADAGDFFITTDACTGTVLTSGSSCRISARFRPGVAAARSAALAVSDSESASPYDIPLTGTGISGSGPTPGQGYWLVASDGGIFTFGTYGFFGSTGSQHLNAPIVGMAVTGDRQGYWLVASDGGVFAFGSARFFGSMGGSHLNRPIVAMAATPDGGGYWLVASDGGIFSFGDANFYGSTGGMSLNAPIVAMAATQSGSGYWLVASDGGVFTFGDAAFRGSTGGTRLNKPIVGIASPGPAGYWLVASDGGIFSFGVPFLGSQGGAHLNKPIVGMAATPSGAGYWLDATDGGIFAFGDASFSGSMGGTPLNKPVNGMTS